MARGTPTNRIKPDTLQQLSVARWAPARAEESAFDPFTAFDNDAAAPNAPISSTWQELACNLAWHFAAHYPGLPTHEKQRALTAAINARGGWPLAYQRLRELARSWDQLSPEAQHERAPVASLSSSARLVAELNDTRRKLASAEARIRELDSALGEVSAHAREDHLTGALNRRGLAEALDAVIAASQRHQQPFAVAILDMDNFKRINDERGHDTGDAALVHFAHTVRGGLRPSDSFARLGGEEFLILLPHASTALAAETVQRLQRTFAPPFFTAGGPPLLLTFSAGVTEYRAGESSDDIIARADKALYEAKQNGKNRVVSA